MKRFVCAFLVIVIGVVSVYSKSSSFNHFKLNFAPSVQQIVYDEDIYVPRVTNGITYGVAFQRSFENSSCLGAELSLAHFSYEGFYSYQDIRLSALMGWCFAEKQYSEQFGVKAFITFNVGISVDIRDDQSTGFYPFFQLGPAVALTMENMSVEFDLDMSASFQNGSTVMQLSPGFSMLFPVGGNSK